MANGFGAGFAALAVVAVIAGLALLLGAASGAAFVLRRRTGRVPTLVSHVAVGLATAAVTLAGFGVLAFVDEAPPAAGLLVAVVLLPLAVGTGTVRRRAALSWLDAVAATAMAWWIPFLVALGAVVGLTAGLTAALDLATASPRRLAVVRVAAAGGGATAVVGTALVARRVTCDWLAAEST
ncbi:MAG: hypothetical protein ABEJ61_09435 [Haloferacaceae archaeon]